MRRILSGLAIAVALTAAAACGSSSSGPSTLTGNWTGTILYTVNGVKGSQNVSMTLSQQDTQVTGSYFTTSVGYFSSTNQGVRGATTGMFSGTLDFVPAAGLGCGGTFDVTGDGGGSTIIWISTNISSTCGSFTPTAVQINLSHQ
jgi:hypothetical protein